MKRIWLIIVLCVVVTSGCKCVRDQEPNTEYMKESEFAAKEYTEAAKRAYNNDPAGYLKLYEIARNDNNKYVTDWSEVAFEEVFLLLYSNTELWVKTFSKVDQKKFRDFIPGGVEVPHTPKGISRELFKETILKNLQKIKGDKSEMELADYILGLYNRKRP